jgi:hypothetical protein
MPETQGPGLQVGHGRAPAAAQSSTTGKSQYSKMALGPLKRHMVAAILVVMETVSASQTAPDAISDIRAVAVNHRIDTLILVRTGSTQARVAVAVKASLKYDVALKREVSVRAHEPGLKPSLWAERHCQWHVREAILLRGWHSHWQRTWQILIVTARVLSTGSRTGEYLRALRKKNHGVRIF